MDSNEKRSYAQMRLANAGITEGNMIFPVKFFDQPIKKKVNLFSEDKSGNLKIRYVDLDGDHEYFLEKNRPKEFFRTRLKNPVDEMKYFQPRNSEKHVYWTPTIINKYQEGKQIETLFITEGEIKAFVGHLQGLDIAGIGGIHNFSNQKENRLLPEIEKLIEKCQVRNIVLLFDADCLSITFKEGKDLYQRPNSFYSAVKKFKELTAPLNVDVYFSHIKSEFEEKAKGLDDLLLYPETNVDELIRELHSLSVNKNRKYIHSLSISENSIYALRKYFAIDKVASFYLKYASILQESEFIFQGSKYKHNGDKLEMLQHKDAKLYLRVGCDYYKEVSKINSRGDYENVLKKWRIGEIKRDYEQKGIKNFIDQIAKYDEFCNIPDNTENYKRQYVLPNYTTNYNLYEPINHPIKEGRIDNTTMFLKHLFTPTSRDSPEYGDPFLIALDYLTILYQHPHHLLPIICLVSKEQGTGKTTFLKWLKAIYKSNATILGNSEFNLDFNTHYINKLLIMIDESFIELDKKHEKERIKKLATSTTQFYHPKGVDASEIDYFGKLIMCSNNENNFIQLEKTDVRFFIIKVKPFEIEDPEFLDKLIEEIPHFLHFLKNRNIFHPKTTRAWFANEHLITHQFKQILRNTRPRLEQDITDYIQDTILTHNLDVFRIDASRLTEAVNKQSKFRHSVADIRRFLKEEKGMIPQKTQRYKIPTLYPDPINPNDLAVLYENANGRPYEFFKEDWLEEE